MRAAQPPDPRRPDGRRGDRRARDRGGSTIELAILWPAILFLVLGAVQVATYFTARTVALSAAQLAVSAERQYNAVPGTGVTRAESFLTASGDWLTDARVGDPVFTPDGVQVTVTGTALSLVPGFKWEISQTARGTIEQFTASGTTP